MSATRDHDLKIIQALKRYLSQSAVRLEISQGKRPDLRKGVSERRVAPPRDKRWQDVRIGVTDRRFKG